MTGMATAGVVGQLALFETGTGEWAEQAVLEAAFALACRLADEGWMQAPTEEQRRALASRLVALSRDPHSAPAVAPAPPEGFPAALDAFGADLREARAHHGLTDVLVLVDDPTSGRQWRMAMDEHGSSGWRESTV